MINENGKILSEIVGTKMGSGNKASTYNWFKNRLADTQGIIVPRSMIDIFAKAANKELELNQRKMTDPVRYHFPDIYLRGLGLQRSGMK